MPSAVNKKFFLLSIYPWLLGPALSFLTAFVITGCLHHAPIAKFGTPLNAPPQKISELDQLRQENHQLRAVLRSLNRSCARVLDLKLQPPKEASPK